ncbi:MAG: T9SS type A sorting domain-containing protein [Ignavibacteriales bacterium]|nr:T9SS type A sorting domain-containing protein [Ignavibacteriales bacterium]
MWTRTYGGNGDDYGYSLKKTDDGGFIIAGTTNTFGAGVFDFYVIRIDSIGDTLWTKTFGGVNNDYAWSVDNTYDGGFVLAGETNAFPEIPNAMFIKIDQFGEQLWNRTYGSILADRAYSIIESFGHKLIIAGTFQILGSDLAGWLLNLNSAGDSLWSGMFGDAFQDYFYAVEMTNDGGYIACGSIRVGELWDLWLIKADSLGNELWSKTFDYDNDGDIGCSVQQTIDGGYIVVGQSSCFDCASRAFIVRTDSSGNILWQKLFNQNASSKKGPVLTHGTDGFLSVKQTQDNGYIIAGYKSANEVSDGYRFQVYLVKLASDIIPIELTAFTATAQQNEVSLNWQTATETNNSGFEIERKQVGSPQSSVSNQDWNQIAFIPGFGTTTERKSYSFIDENLLSGIYQYRLKQIDFDGSFEYSNTVEVEINSPTEFTLEQNYPNPFNPSTVISYSLPQKEFVTIKVIDILGREVAILVNEVKPAGKFEVEFDASSLASGVYVYQIKAGSFTTSKKMLLTK